MVVVASVSFFELCHSCGYLTQLYKLWGMSWRIALIKTDTRCWWWQKHWNQLSQKENKAVLSFQDLSCWLTLSWAHNLVTSAVWSVQLCLETQSFAWDSSSLWGVSGALVGSLCKSWFGVFFPDWLTSVSKLLQASSKQTAPSKCICKASSSRAAARRRSGLRGRSPKGSGLQRMSHSKLPSLPRSVEMKVKLAVRVTVGNQKMLPVNQKNRSRGSDKVGARSARGTARSQEIAWGKWRIGVEGKERTEGKTVPKNNN